MNILQLFGDLLTKGAPAMQATPCATAIASPGTGSCAGGNPQIKNNILHISLSHSFSSSLKLQLITVLTIRIHQLATEYYRASTHSKPPSECLMCAWIS